MKHKIAILWLLVISSCAAVEAPPIVGEGYQAYIAKGMNGGIERWMKGSALEGDKTSQMQMIGGLSQIEAAYGKAESFEILGVYNLSKRLERVYAVAYHPKGPVFAYFDLFKNDDGEWVLYMFFFNTKPQEILPRELVDRKG